MKDSDILSKISEYSDQIDRQGIFNSPRTTEKLRICKGKFCSHPCRQLIQEYIRHSCVNKNFLLYVASDTTGCVSQKFKTTILGERDHTITIVQQRNAQPSLFLIQSYLFILILHMQPQAEMSISQQASFVPFAARVTCIVCSTRHLYRLTTKSWNHNCSKLICKMYKQLKQFFSPFCSVNCECPIGYCKRRQNLSKDL